jgi:hypothetical protein
MRVNNPDADDKSQPTVCGVKNRQTKDLFFPGKNFCLPFIKGAARRGGLPALGMGGGQKKAGSDGKPKPAILKGTDAFSHCRKRLQTSTDNAEIKGRVLTFCSD